MEGILKCESGGAKPPRSRKKAVRMPVLLIAVLAVAAFLWPQASSLNPPSVMPARESGPGEGPGVTERLGEVLPPDIVCLDENGAEVRLAALLDRPAILSLVYYSCEHICPQVLVALGRLVSDPALKPWSGFRLITLSFDSADAPGDAALAKLNYSRPLPRDFPRENWRFLTASERNIDRLTERLGFRFKKEMHGFIHPAVLVILGPGGLISRYAYVSKFDYGVSYPVTFSPVDIAASLRKAAAGETQAGLAEPVLFCFPHEPPSQSRYFGLLNLAGLATLACLAALFGFLAAGRRKRTPADGKR
jgi:protein SCO1/2